MSIRCHSFSNIFFFFFWFHQMLSFPSQFIYYFYYYYMSLALSLSLLCYFELLRSAEWKLIHSSANLFSSFCWYLLVLSSFSLNLVIYHQHIYGYYYSFFIFNWSSLLFYSNRIVNIVIICKCFLFHQHNLLYIMSI